MPIKLNKVYYHSFEELIDEWEEKEYPGPFWKYLGLSKQQFENWVYKRKHLKYDT